MSRRTNLKYYSYGANVDNNKKNTTDYKQSFLPLISEEYIERTRKTPKRLNFLDVKGSNSKEIDIMAPTNSRNFKSAKNITANFSSKHISTNFDANYYEETYLKYKKENEKEQKKQEKKRKLIQLSESNELRKLLNSSKNVKKIKPFQFQSSKFIVSPNIADDKNNNIPPHKPENEKLDKIKEIKSPRKQSVSDNNLKNPISENSKYKSFTNILKVLMKDDKSKSNSIHKKFSDEVDKEINVNNRNSNHVRHKSRATAHDIIEQHTEENKEAKLNLFNLENDSISTEKKAFKKKFFNSLMKRKKPKSVQYDNTNQVS